jgi:hypothetical protein
MQLFFSSSLFLHDKNVLRPSCFVTAGQQLVKLTIRCRFSDPFIMEPLELSGVFYPLGWIGL